MVDRDKLTPLEQAIFDNVIAVRDPEFGQSIGDRGLIDEVKGGKDAVHITYHLTVPFCPDVFAFYIGSEIRKKALEVVGVSRVEVTVKDHIHANELNQKLQTE